MTSEQFLDGDGDRDYPRSWRRGERRSTLAPDVEDKIIDILRRVREANLDVIAQSSPASPSDELVQE